MARKKAEVHLLREIETQEEWEEIMSKDGLWVVDVYQDWSGPCDAMVGNFRRIKNELGDELLHFAMAKADAVESLEKYRGNCEPCFLFFAGGVLVSYVHGANAPLILRTLTEQLAQEHKVLDGNAERLEVKDPFVLSRELEEEEEEVEEETENGKFLYNDELIIYDDDLTPVDEYEEVEEGFTVAIIKPNAVAAGQVEEIINEMKAKGIQILAQDERRLTPEEAKEFYSHQAGQEYFDDLVNFMSSGPSHVLVLTKGKADDSVIKEWRDLLGPPAVEKAKEEAPESLRAKYGTEGIMNALHGSDCKDTAARELAFFFPSMEVPTISQKKKPIQRTLALIRPEAFARSKDAILQRIKEAGFQIALQKEIQLTKAQAEEFYQEHSHQPYFDQLTTSMSSGPLLALGLAHEEAITNWRQMLGPAEVKEAKEMAPNSLRAQFASEEEIINPLHGSDSIQAAKKELEFFFPMEQTVAMIKPDAYGTKEAIIDKIHEAGFRIAARKESLITRDIAESIYEEHRGKEYFNDLVEHMTSGPTMFMVLSREGAVEGWRQEIGPTDPGKAKVDAPDSIRAKFGTDFLQNAVHGASTSDEAKAKIERMFGHLQFNRDGTVQEEIEGEGEEQSSEMRDDGADSAEDEGGEMSPEIQEDETERDATTELSERAEETGKENELESSHSGLDLNAETPPEKDMPEDVEQPATGAEEKSPTSEANVEEQTAEQSKPQTPEEMTVTLQADEDENKNAAEAQPVEKEAEDSEQKDKDYDTTRKETEDSEQKDMDNDTTRKEAEDSEQKVKDNDTARKEAEATEQKDANDSDIKN